MKNSKIKEWISKDQENKAFRQAAHTVLLAISKTKNLQVNMVMKGGLLLSIAYGSSRFTKDIDFSTSILRKDFDEESFKKSLEEGLVDAVENLDYGLDCKIQKTELKPSKNDATFPTFKINIGYAYKYNRNAHKSLMAKKSSNVIKIDYSLNEPFEDIDFLELEDGCVVRTYNLVEIIAEKFRAVLQQEKRNRHRRQDIYDINYIIENNDIFDDNIKTKILARLIKKSVSRNIDATKESLSNPEIRKRSEAEYANLASEIEEELPDFNEIYNKVENYYRSLPWV